MRSSTPTPTRSSCRKRRTRSGGSTSCTSALSARSRLLNQYQRKQDGGGRLISEKADLQAACDILFESILLKVDELDGSLRQFFEKLKAFVQKKGKDHEFNRFELREALGLSKSRQHYYISRLVELEYLVQYGHANRGYRYRIAHWDNIAAVRARIKDSLQNQLDKL
jgi:DNA primase